MPKFSRITAAAAFILVLCSCAQTPLRHSTSLPDCAEILPVRDMDDPISAQVSQANLDRRHATVATLEESLTQKEAVRSQTLSDLARLCFAIGEAAAAGDKRNWYEKGRHYAELLCREEPDRVEGYYWLALNLCGICETSGAGTALATLPKIVDNLKSAIEIDQAYDQAGPLRVLGRIRLKAPSWPISEGDLNDSLNLLRLAVQTAPNNSTNRLYLAETLTQLNKMEEACFELERALSTACHASSPHQLKEDQEQAIALRADCASIPNKEDSRGKNLAWSAIPALRQARSGL